MSGLNYEDFFNEFKIFVIWKDDPDEEKAQKLLRESYLIRHQVFKQESRFPGYADANPFEDQGDEYDVDSAHILLFHLPSNSWVGTCRLILNRGKSFLPIENVADGAFPFQDFLHHLLPYEETAEISRFALLKTKSMSLAILGLFNGMHLICRKLNIHFLYFVMTKSLERRLSLLGIKFFPITEEVEHFGRRIGYICGVENGLKNLRESNEAAWRIITETPEEQGVIKQKAA